MELPKYEKGVGWLRDILHNTRFTAERLRVVAKRLTGDIAGYKRKGNNVVRTLLRSLVYSKGKIFIFHILLFLSETVHFSSHLL